MMIITISCKNSYDEVAVNKTLSEFLDAMKKPVDFKKMKEHYIGYSFHSVPTVGEYTIESINQENDDIIVNVSTTYKNRARVYNTDFILKLKEVDGNWKIIDSKGMSNFKMMFPEAYNYAINNKLFDVNSNDKWDLEMDKIIKKADKEAKKLIERE